MKRLSALVLLSTLVLAFGAGCVTVHATVPDEAIRQHMIHEEGIDVPAQCHHAGHPYTEGARVCMEGRRMACDAEARWVPDGDC